jgi:hypothetical protein
MAVLALSISIIALIGAYAAYRKSGGSTQDLKRKIEELGVCTETLRCKMADILENLEKKVRGEEKKPECQLETKGHTQQDAHV